MRGRYSQEQEVPYGGRRRTQDDADDSSRRTGIRRLYVQDRNGRSVSEPKERYANCDVNAAGPGYGQRLEWAIPVRGRNLSRVTGLGSFLDHQLPLKEEEDREEEEHRRGRDVDAAAAAPYGDVGGGGILPSARKSGGEVVEKTLRCHCVGDAFVNKGLLMDLILRRTNSPSIRTFSEVFCAKHSQLDVDAENEVFYFDWGTVVVCGGGEDSGGGGGEGGGGMVARDYSGGGGGGGGGGEYEEYLVEDLVVPCLNRAYPVQRREVDQLILSFSPSPKTVIENDEICLDKKYADDDDVLLALSFALAQSTKLRVCEEDFRLLMRKLSHIPESLAETGQVPRSAEEVMKYMGELYTQMADVNLLGAALDLPDDLPPTAYVRSLYKAAYGYLEVAERLAVLHERFGVVKEMLELCRSLAQHGHADYLEKVIIYLLVVCGLIAMIQLIAEFAANAF